MKICNKCFESKDFLEFYYKESNTDKLMSKYKECYRLTKKQYYENNKEKAKEYYKQYITLIYNPYGLKIIGVKDQNIIIQHMRVTWRRKYALYKKERQIKT